MHCTCCRNCENRHAGCHSKCEEYAEFVRLNNLEKEKIQLEKLKDSIVHRYGTPGICFGAPGKRRTHRNGRLPFLDKGC